MVVKQSMWKKACTVHFLSILILSGIFWPAHAVEISDQPMLSAIKPPPANIMFLIDNSQSMDFEILLEGRKKGLFYRQSDLLEVFGYAYLFGNDGLDLGADVESSYDLDQNIRRDHMRKRVAASRQYWESRCYGYNRLYYNPSAFYLPWPESGSGQVFGNADPLNPKLNPVKSQTVSMKDTYLEVRRADLDSRDIELDDDMADRQGQWERKNIGLGLTDIAAFNGHYHATRDDNAKITYPFHLSDAGRHQIQVNWPLYTALDLAQVVVRTGDAFLRVYDHSGRVLYDKEKITQRGRNGLTIEVEVVSLNPHGPDIFVELSSVPNNTSGAFNRPAWLVADNVEVQGRTKISNAHYFMFDDANDNTRVDTGERVFLVNFVWHDFGSGEELYRQIYEIPGGNRIRDRKLDVGFIRAISPGDLPLRLRKLYDGAYREDGSQGDDENAFYLSPEADLQNFANWFQYYRTKLLATKSAIANTIYNLSGVNIGFHTIKKDVTQPVLYVGNKGDATVIIVDDRDGGEYYEEWGPMIQWADSHAPVAYNSKSRNSVSTIFTADAWAKWRADVPVTGEYDVYVRWSRYGRNAWRDRRAEYKVGLQDEDGNISWGETFVVNQNGDERYGFPDRWNKLTRINVDNLHDGKEVVVKLTRGDIWPHRPTNADAIKLVRRGGGGDEDNSKTLLDRLYAIETKIDLIGDKKPLREGLDTIGRYYATDLSAPADSELGDSPYVSESEGGGCQQAFVIMTTDGLWTDTDHVNVGDADGDGVANTLADVAMYYYERDLAPDLPNLVPVNTFDQNSQQHMVTYAVAFGNAGRINPDTHKYWESDADPRAWPWPEGSFRHWDDRDKMDDLFHATVNGRGRYFNASSPDELLFSMRSTLEDIIMRSQATGASLSVDSQRIQQGMTVFQTEYYPMDWLGDLKAKGLDPIGSGLETGSEKWSAAYELSRLGAGDRNIISAWGSTAFAFRPASVPDSLKATMRDNVGGLPSSVTSSDIIAYLRGDDKTGFRKRYARHEDAPVHHYKTGDFVHSAPVYHRGLVYVGANDGMMHAFDARSGQEIFAFVPSFVYPDLWELMRPDYMDSHRYFVDGPISVRTLVDDGSLKDVLVGGLRKGGKGYYGMTLRDSLFGWDVAKAGASEGELATKLSVWEFPPSDERGSEEDMGYSFSSAAIVKANTLGNPPVAVFGNGYNSSSGEAVLIIVNALTGGEIRRIKTGAAGGNGLSSPAVVDIDGDGTADWVYAGDLQGNMWKFDISSDNAMDWGVFFSRSGQPAPLFRGVGKAGEDPQSVTTKPGVARHCSGVGYTVVWGTGRYLHESDMENFDQQTFYGVWDYWGPSGDTGQEKKGLGTLDRSDVIHVGDVNPKANHYGLDGSAYRLVEQRVRVTSGVPRDGELVGQTGPGVTSEVASHTSFPQTFEWEEDSDGRKVLKEGSTVGWFFDLPDMGERMVQDATIHGPYAFGISFVPEGSVSLCESGGYSWFNAVESCTGARADQVVFDVDGDGRLDAEKDVLKVDKDGYHVSRRRVEGMMYTPVTLHGREYDALLASTSHSNSMVNMVIVKEGEGLFYWRMR
ncbi:PilC-like protein with beta-propeller domain [Desulfobotulus alkaliphilus]|uniref:PilC-like protein with beta-propeller domain n=1 Tax=Desulfobotulus alkaliphilus TaxID=622671 RepID=A0A562RTZ5_9BACT|nr:PilC/PilY family type IV pilus protein [Desulfobotulus alkaliphilus]TWI71816.1 PilC-like protein with beta-propeller domain [Desulfobotulus alkaliphilus]